MGKNKIRTLFEKVKRKKNEYKILEEMVSEKVIGHGISTELSPPFPCALQMFNSFDISVFRWGRFDAS